LYYLILYLAILVGSFAWSEVQ